MANRIQLLPRIQLPPGWRYLYPHVRDSLSCYKDFEDWRVTVNADIYGPRVYLDGSVIWSHPDAPAWGRDRRPPATHVQEAIDWAEARYSQYVPDFQI